MKKTIFLDYFTHFLTIFIRVYSFSKKQKSVLPSVVWWQKTSFLQKSMFCASLYTRKYTFPFFWFFLWCKFKFAKLIHFQDFFSFLHVFDEIPVSRWREKNDFFQIPTIMKADSIVWKWCKTVSTRNMLSTKTHKRTKPCHVIGSTADIACPTIHTRYTLRRTHCIERLN